MLTAFRAVVIDSKASNFRASLWMWARCIILSSGILSVWSYFPQELFCTFWDRDALAYPPWEEYPRGPRIENRWRIRLSWAEELPGSLIDHAESHALLILLPQGRVIGVRVFGIPILIRTTAHFEKDHGPFWEGPRPILRRTTAHFDVDLKTLFYCTTTVLLLYYHCITTCTTTVPLLTVLLLYYQGSPEGPTRDHPSVPPGTPQGSLGIPGGRPKNKLKVSEL